MRHLFAALALAAAPAFAQTALPSGLEVTPLDTLEEAQPGGETWLVLRYLAPAIAGGAVGYDAVLEDLHTLCVTEGLAAQARLGHDVTQITVILLDSPVERGAVAPDVTQYIGAYLPIDTECEWNDF